MPSTGRARCPLQVDYHTRPAFLHQTVLCQELQLSSYIPSQTATDTPGTWPKDPAPQSLRFDIKECCHHQTCVLILAMVFKLSQFLWILINVPNENFLVQSGHNLQVPACSFPASAYIFSIPLSLLLGYSIINTSFLGQFSLVAQSCLTLQPHGLQQARLTWSSPTLGQGRKKAKYSGILSKHNLCLRSNLLLLKMKPTINTLMQTKTDNCLVFIS